MAAKPKPRQCAVILEEISGLLAAEARLRDLRDELARAKSRDRMIVLNRAQRRNPAVSVTRAASLREAMKGNQNSLGVKRSPEFRANAAARAMGNTHSLGRKDSVATLARKAAPAARKRGIPIVPSPAPDRIGLCPDYVRDRVVFYYPAHGASL